MPDLDEIIGDSLTAAGLTETNDMGELVSIEDPTPESPETPSGGDEHPEEHPAEEGSEESGKEKVAGEAPIDGDDLDRELQGLGIQPKDTRGGESRIRYSRVRKIWDNYKKKLSGDLSEQHGKTVKDLEAKIQTTAERIGYYDNLEKLVKTDQRRYLEMLVMAEPKFRQYVNLSGEPSGGGAAAAVAAAADDKMPGPDAQFTDGTRGYSPEGFQKALEWNTQRTMRLVEDRFKQQYGKPLENLTQSQRMAAAARMHESNVRANVDQAKRVYGKLFTDDFGELGNVNPNSKIVEALKANPRLSLNDACAVALIPKMQADQNAIRERVLKELQERPAGAHKSAPGAEKAAALPVPKSTEEIIANEMRKSGLL